MKNDLSASHPGGQTAAPSGNAWSRFWFTPIPTTGFHCLRVLSGLLFLFWLLTMLGHQESFFSLQGWLDRQAIVELQKPQENMPPPAQFGWSIFYLAGDNTGRFEAIYWGSVVIVALFTLGVATRITGILTWIIVVSFLANSTTGYEADYLLGILAFYLMIGHVLAGQWNGNLSPLERVLGARADFVFGRWVFASSDAVPPVSYAANLTMRLLQIHLAIILVTSGLHKLQMGDWWSGAALWYPLHRPFHTTLDSLNREKPSAATLLFFLSLVEYMVLAWEIGFPTFAWRKRGWRVLLLGGAAVYWLGNLLIFQLPLFGPFVFLGCLSFLGPEEWAWLENRWRAWVGPRSARNVATIPRKIPAIAGSETIKK